MGNQEICINRKKQNFRKKKRIVKKSMRNQSNVTHKQPTTTQPVLTDKKARREARKLQAKMQKKAVKKQRRQAKMDVQSQNQEENN